MGLSVALAELCHWRHRDGSYRCHGTPEREAAPKKGLCGYLCRGVLAGCILSGMEYRRANDLDRANAALQAKVEMLKGQVDDTAAKDAQIRELQTRIRALTPDEGSLKNRALKAAAELDAFFKQRTKHQPTCTQTSSMTPEQQREAILPCAKYNGETEMIYQQQFGPNIMAMVQEFKAKGMNVINIENCALGGYCGIAIPVQLRAFAAQLDAKDNVKARQHSQ